MASDPEDITTLKDTFATKEELTTALEAVNDKLDAGFSAMMDRLESVQDQMLRAFAMTEESIRKDHSHVDEVADIDNRLNAVEEKLGING